MEKNYSDSNIDWVSKIRTNSFIDKAKFFMFFWITFFLVGISTEVKAQSGIFESFVIIDSGFGNNYYDLNPQIQTANFDFNGTNLGTFNSISTLILNGAQNKTFKCPGDNITQCFLFYRIYKIGDPVSSYNSTVLFFNSNIVGAICSGGQNQIWESTGSNINVLSGLCPGNYNLEVYTNADFSYNYGSNFSTHYFNNGGFDYKATFTVVDTDTIAPVTPTLADVNVGQCNGTPTSPTTTDACVGTITGTTLTNFPITTQGITIVTWAFDDGNGNSTTANQNVIVDDTIAAVPDLAVLPTITGQCSATVTAPTATDDCSGIITGTTASPLSFTTQGTYTIVWTYNDGNANSTTQNQTVIVDDTVAPIPNVATLPTIIGQCDATVTAPTATDDCSGIITGTTASPLSYTTQGTYTIVWTYNDGNGNTTTQNQTVIVDDTVAPIPNVATLPTIIGQCDATVTAPTATDNCSGIITGTTASPLSYTTQGTFTIVWTYEDGNGNTTTQNQTVIVDDTVAPVPNVATLPTITGQCSATVTAPTATDDCSGIITGTTASPLSYATQGTFTIVWTYDDNKGNTITQNQTVIVDDTVAPVPNVATLPTVTGQCDALVTAPTATDNCSGIITGTTASPLSYTTQGTYTIVWTYNDGNANSTTQNQTVIVDDTVAPIPNVATLPTIIGQCDATVTAPTATDDCSGIITGTTASSLSYSTQGTFNIVWTYDDNNGNIITQNQTVIVDDTIAPVPNVATLPTINGQCGATVTAPTATDVCSGTITGTTASPLSYTTQGTFNIVWTYDDNNGNIITQNQTVIVDDTIAPVPNVATLPTITGQCSATVTVPTATDDCSGTITGTTASPLSYTTQGTFNIVWTYDDNNGNIITQNQTVIVDDTIAPVTPTLADVNVGQCNGTPTTPTTTDTCLGTITGTTTTSFPITTQGTTIVTWTFADGNGNSTTANQNVIVDDINKPSLTAIANRNENIVTACNFTIPDYTGLTTASDNCTATGSIIKTQLPVLGTVISGHNTTQLITITADDGNGNNESTTFTITLEDVTPPTITTCPITATPNTSNDGAGNCTTIVSLGTPAVSDNCTAVGNIIVTAKVGGVTINPSTYLFGIGNTTVVWTATDQNGNVSMPCYQTVTVIDNENPTINCPANISVAANIGCTATGVTLGTPTTNDNCSVASVTNTAPVAFPLGITTVTWIATDTSGNTATCTQTVTVLDPTAASISYGGTPFCANVVSGIPTINILSGGPFSELGFSSTAGLIINSTTGVITPSTSISGTYVVTYTFTGANGCTNITSTSVTINPLPTATIGGSTAVCQNSAAPNITFTGGIGTAPYTFTYKLNGGANQTVATSSGNSVTISAPTGTPGVFTYSLVSVSDANGCTQLQSGTATITVYTLPTASITGSTIACQNSAPAPNITFTGANGVTPYTFTYTLNGGSNLTVTTSAGNSVTVPASTAITGNSVYNLVSVSDANGCSQPQSGTANINVKPTPTSATISGTTAVCQNAGTPNLTFTGFGGTTPYTFTYNINGGSNQTVSTVGGNSITVAAPTGTAGTFTYSLVSIRDLNSCILPQTGSAVITINPLPTAVIVGTTAVCFGGTSPNITFTGATGTAPYTFTYKINGGANQTITTVVGNSVTVAAPTGTSGGFTYSLVSVSDGNGCSQSQVGSATITVNTLPTASVSGTLAVCQNNSAPNITFTGATGTAPYTFTYNVDGGTNQTVTTVSGNSITVAAPTGTVGTFNYNLISVSDNNLCTQSQSGTATITVKTNPTVNAVADAIYCNGATGSAISFSSNPIGATFSWTSSADIGFGTSGNGNIASFTAINTGSAAVIATISVIATANSCLGIATTFTITVNPSPAVNAIGNVSNCNGASISGISFSSATAGVTYDWTSSIDVGFDLSGTGDIPTFIGQNPGTTPITATVSVTASANGCTGPPRTFTITINPSPVLTSSLSPGTICSNSLFSYVPTSSLAGTSFSWTRAVVAGISNAASSGSGNINETLINTTSNPLGVTYVYSLTSGGCSDTFTMAVVVVPAPTVTVTATPSTICVGGSTTLSSSSSIVASLPATLLTQNFNGATNNWTRTNASTGDDSNRAAWTLRPDNYNAGPRLHSNDNSQFYLSDSQNGDRNNDDTSTTLVSPSINTMGYTGLSLNFYQYYDDTNSSEAKVEVSTNGSNWTTVTTYNSDQGAANSFANTTINLDGYVGNTTLYVRFFYFASQRAKYWAIDNVTITGTAPSATVSWTSVPAGFTSSVANPGSVSPAVTTVYTATYTDPNNTACPGSNSVTVTVNPKPVIPNQTTSVCTGSAFTVTPTNGVPTAATIVPAGTTYTWLAPTVTGGMTGGSAQSDQPSISQTLTNTTAFVQTATYSVTATTGSCAASAPFTVVVSVNPKPIVNNITGAPFTYCNGVAASAINFSSTTTPAGIVSYAWTSSVDVGFGLSGTGNIPIFTALNTTNAAITATISVTASTLAGCSGAQKTFTVTVNPTPTVTITANYCAVAGKIQLTATGGGTYLWNTGQTINPILVDVAGVYSVTATVGSCSATDYLDVSQELVVNSNFTSGNTGFTSGYTYYPNIAGNNELVPDNGTNGYAVGTSGQNYHYDFWGIDHTNNATGPRNFMLVNGHGSITIWQQTVNVQPNTDYYFSAWAMSLNDVGPYAQLRFEVNGVQVGTTAVLEQGPSNATQAAANNYWTRFYSTPFWNSGGVSGPITIKIVNLEDDAYGNDFALDDISFGTLSAVPFSISPTGNLGTLCAGQTFNLNANLTNGKAPIKYSWTGPNGFTSNLANPSILNVTTLNAGTYTLTVTDGYGCGPQSGTVTLAVTPLPTCSISGNDNVCPGSTNTYSAPIGMTSYSWSVTAGSATISGPSTGQTVAVIAPASCGAYTLSLTIVNNSCSSTCVQSFNAVDTTKPVISLVAATALGCNANAANVAAAFGTATVTDNCSTGLVATGTIAPEIVSGCTVSVTKNWTVTDICGNIGTNSQTVTFTRDTTNPVIAITATTALGCNPSAANINSAFGTATVTDNCSVGLSATSTTAAEINTSGCTYSTTRTWTVTDNCGNIGTNSQTVTYTRDTTAPVLVGVPANTSAQCNALPVAATVTATDGCSAATVSAAVDVITLGSCSGNYSITRTWTATDLCGNSASASQIITVIDNTPPVLLGIPANVAAQCNLIPAVPGAGVVTATDNCGTATVTGPVIVNIPGSCVGSSTITRTWTATDQCGNSITATQTITVIDTIAPILANIPSNVSVLCSSIPLPPASGVVTATDNCSMPSVSTSVDVITPGSCTGSFIITRTWTATDQCGNSATASQIITVSDYIAPVLSGIPFNTTVQCNAIPAVPTVTATDNCDVGPIITLNEIITLGSCPNTYTLVRTWTATDSCGNSSSESQTINVIDNTLPAITCTSSQTFCQVAGNNYTIPTLVASDNCSGALNTTFSITGSTSRSGSGNDASGVFNVGVSTITWTVADACGNTSNCSVMVTINAMPTAPIVGTITQPDCMIPTGSVVLSGLPAGNWTINPGGITGNTVSITITGLAANTYNFTVTLGTCTSTPSANVVIQAATTATWNGGVWTNGPPTIDQALVFTGDYNSTGDLTACSCTVTNGAVVFNPNHTLKITNWVHVNGGSLTFKDNSSLVQINDVSNTNLGNIFYERQTTEVSNMDYTYWSSPVAGFTLGGVSPLTLGDKFYSYDVNIEDWKQEWASTQMAIGIGYIIRGPQTHKAPAVPSRALANFNGVPNNGPYTITGIIPDRSYLLGNPYPSALDADTFLLQNNNILDGTLYFWTHNTPIAVGTPDPGTGLWAYSGNDYASYNGVGGVATKKAISGVFGINNDNIPSGKITSGQGFFGSSIAAPSGSAILYNNTMRVGVGGITGNNSQFFKTKNSNPKTTNVVEKHRIWLDLINTQGAFKQTLVGYVTDATNGYEGRFDGESYDGNDFLDFYSINQDKNLTIQGRALPFDDNDEIPLGYRVAIGGTFSVIIDQTDGLLSNKPVFIEDKLTNTIFNLKDGKYTFTTAAGTFDDRFVLRYKDKTLGLDEVEVNDGIIALYSNNYKTLIIRNNVKDATVNSVTLYNITGQKITNWDVKGREQSSIQIPMKNLPAEIYIVKIKTTKGEFSKKIIIK